MKPETEILVLGAGYVGLTTAVCLAWLGHRVTCYDHDPDLIADLTAGESPLDEPDLARMLGESLASSKLHFTDHLTTVHKARFTMMCLPTPPREDGSADLTAIDTTTRQLRNEFAADSILIIRSTVPIGTNHHVRQLLDRDDVAVVSNPEFLREGHAIYDFLHPTRIVLGSDDRNAAQQVQALFESIKTEIIATTPTTAEFAKYSANAYLATRLSYVNALARLADSLNADIDDATRILGADPRIGSEYLSPGPGWGGPCLPKDIRALAVQSRHAGVEFALLDAAIADNLNHQHYIVDRIRNQLHGLTDRRIGVLGLTFKSGTCDRRESPAETIARLLASEGAILLAHDPTVTPDTSRPNFPQSVETPYDAALGSDAILVLTEWNQYNWLDWHRIATNMNGRLIFDARGYIDRTAVRSARLCYVGIGRPSSAGDRMTNGGDLAGSEQHQH
ncbi:UDP-glucose dehydrogenase family protein [Nocardia takedensis]|uniref:UDP-glucose dehydrogenase family protein n=1 Tax=Nocardia takedensis TaxID=259390 RepID=UPI0002F44BEB|nr:UDP-glucose/GDP-mannose dehydrogenase family protein [Nocardia takedensis]